MRPLFPTFATANCLPSRPAEPPSGVISHLSSSWLPFLARRTAGFSSWGLRSVTGSSGFVCALAVAHSFVFARPVAAGPPRPGLDRSPPLPNFGGGRRRRASRATLSKCDAGCGAGRSLGGSCCGRDRVGEPVGVGTADGSVSIAEGQELSRRALAAATAAAAAAGDGDGDGCDRRH